MAIKMQFYNNTIKSAELRDREVASMAKLVRRHTSNVEIIGSNPIGSIQSRHFVGAYFFPRRVRGATVILDRHVLEDINGTAIMDRFFPS